MASKRMCPQTVTMYNYAGEVNDKASYVKTYLHHVKCIVYRGADSSIQGRGETDASKLYIFDDILFAADSSGHEVQYISPEEWQRLSDKTGYWTMSTDGDDFYVDGECPEDYPRKEKKFRIAGIKRLDQGSRRMVHFEVDGE